MNIWLSSLRIRAHLSWRTGKHLHVLHVLRTYSTCSYPGYQDTTTYAALPVCLIRRNMSWQMAWEVHVELRPRSPDSDNGYHYAPPQATTICHYLPLTTTIYSSLLLSTPISWKIIYCSPLQLRVLKQQHLSRLLLLALQILQQSSATHSAVHYSPPQPVEVKVYLHVYTPLHCPDSLLHRSTLVLFHLRSPLPDSM